MYLLNNRKHQQYNGPTAIAATITNAACGTSDGTLTLGAVTGGLAPYTYSVDASAYSSTLVYNNLAAGSHDINVKDANGCIFSTTASISNTTGPTAIATTKTDASCGTANGSITLGAVTGGLAPYTYSVDASAYSATLVYNNLAAGSHDINVKDANGCIFSTTASISNTTGPTAVATTKTDASCGTANGSITLGAVTGGVVPYTYSVDASAYSATLVYNNLAAGSHDVNVKDANGCIFSTTASISNTTGPTAIATTKTDASCGTANGSITLGAVTGGLAPYTYSVDASAYSATLVYNNLAAGSHDLKVKDANGCIFSTTASISNTTGPTAIATTKTDASCGTANGSITLGAVTGGLAPYTYSVDASAYSATTNYNRTCSGPHDINVKDANGCIFSTTASISNTTGPTAIATTKTDASCGTANGSITLGAVTGGLAPYTYSVDASAYSSTLVYNNLAAGSHDINVKDANGCIFSTTASISNTTGPTAIAATITNAACGTSDGTLTLGAVTGGVAPYTYSVDASAYSATLVYNNLAAGSHDINVKDANGCIFSTTASISNTTGLQRSQQRRRMQAAVIMTEV
jgi:hypothetical protein